VLYPLSVVESTEPKQVYGGKVDFVSERKIKDIIIITLALCNWPRPEDAHAAARPPPHPHASLHLTNNDGLRWKTDGRPPANGPPTTVPPQKRHSPSTQARGPPRPPTPRPSPQLPPPSSQSQGQVPITEQNFLFGGKGISDVGCFACLHAPLLSTVTVPLPLPTPTAQPYISTLLPAPAQGAWTRRPLFHHTYNVFPPCISDPGGPENPVTEVQARRNSSKKCNKRDKIPPIYLLFTKTEAVS
jgi:hypothetical protein